MRSTHYADPVRVYASTRHPYAKTRYCFEPQRAYAGSYGQAAGRTGLGWAQQCLRAVTAVQLLRNETE